MPQASLYIEKVHCITTTGEAGKDAIYMVVEVDGYRYGCYPGEGSGCFVFKKSGGTLNVDVNITANYNSSVYIKLMEKDDKKDYYHSNDKQKDDFVASWTVNRHSPMRATLSGNGYKVDYRMIANPIPAIRVHGIHCHTESFGCNKDAIDQVAQYIEYALKAAAKIVGTSKRPKAQVAKKALKKAADEVNKARILMELRLHALEGQDDVFLKHVNPGEGNQNSKTGQFWPQGKDIQKMGRDDSFGFEESGQINGEDEYFRFPVDYEEVSVRAIENDIAKGNITLGQLTFSPTNITNDARFDGPAFVEVMPEYGKRNNEGAVYLMCYSIGMEDFAKPAICDNLGYP